MKRDLFKGVTFGFYARNGYFSSEVAAKEAEKIAELGCSWVCLVATVMQERFSSTRQFRDFTITPGDDELCDIMNLFHKLGVKVMFRPMLECWDGTQRGHLQLPASGEIIPGKPIHYREDWFENYAALTRHYLRIANRCSCEGYCLDSELNPFADFSEHWLRIVDVVRKNYKGHLTTSLIAAEQFLPLIQRNPNHWFFALDSLGSSMYSPASEHGGGTVDEMAAYLAPVVQRTREFAEVYGKPFYFGECGCCATAGASKLPYFWNNGGGYDGREQANYLDAVIRAFSPEEWWGGLFWWKWDEQNYRPQFVDDPAGNKGFTMDGKPAAEVMRRWCAENGSSAAISLSAEEKRG